MMSVFVLAAACNGTTAPSEDDGNAQVGRTSSSIVAIAQTPRSSIELLMKADREAVAREAIGYLHAQRDLIGMRSPQDELRVIHAQVDELAMTHVRFHQIERGLRVDGGNVNVHFDKSGAMTSIEKHYVPDLAAMNVTPAVSASAASMLAIADRVAAMNGSKKAPSVVGTPELVVFARSWMKTPVLAWELRVKASRISDWTVRVDAQTGAIIHAASRIHAIAGTGIGLDGQSHPVNFTQDQGTNVLVDSTHTASIAYFDSLNQPLTNDQIGVITSNSANSWDATSSLGRGSAVSAQQTIGATVDFYQKTFQRAGWMGDGSEMDIVMHEPDDDGTPGLDNAFYSPAPDNYIAIGDGKTELHPLAQFLDVLAHEFTHGVTGAHANLNEDNQPNALNESISDCFGAIVEHSLKPDPVKNWQIGEGTLVGTDQPLRDMAHPETGPDGAQPSNMSGFDATTDADPHMNAGITSTAAFLATMGGTNSVSKITVPAGIGWDNFAKVWYRADTVYLQETSTFADMADATAKAAADLKLSEADTDNLACAWIAVGVTQGTCKAAPAAKTQSQTPATTDDPSDTSTSTTGSTSSKKKKTSSSSSSSEAPVGAGSAGCNASSGASGNGFALALVAIAALFRRRRR